MRLNYLFSNTVFQYTLCLGNQVIKKPTNCFFLPMFSCNIFSLHVFSMDVMKILTLKWTICFLVYTKMFADKYFVIFLVYNQNLLFEIWDDEYWLNLDQFICIVKRYWKVTLKKCHVDIRVDFQTALFNLWHQQDNFIDNYVSSIYNPLFVDAKEFLTKN